MEQDKIEGLLLKLIEDMAIVKAKLDSLDEVKLEHKENLHRIEKLEMQNERHEKQISTIEHRCSEMEQFIRDKITDTNKTQRNAFISMGLAIFSAMVSLLFNFLK